MPNIPAATDHSADASITGVSAEIPATAPAQSTTDALKYDQRVLRSLRRIVRSIELHSKHLSASSRITAPQLVCLLTVVQLGPISATSISREVALSASTVVGILDRLEEKGWITRTRARDDRRIVMVAATAAGVVLSQQAPSPLQHRLSAALNALPELERATIALSLERVVSLMEEQVVVPMALHGSGFAGPAAI
jgi:DNA-binding MarR family transcriptional regulator